MYTIQSSFVDNYSSLNSLNNLIVAIDKTIEKMALCEYNNIRFRLSNQCVSLDDYDDLVTYRKILMTMLIGCNCLDDLFLIKIVSKIKKLII